jgi:hypothetical protein
MSEGQAGRPSIGKQYGIKFPAEEAAYVERVRIAQKLKTFSAAVRLIVRDAMHNRRLEGTE